MSRFLTALIYSGILSVISLAMKLTITSSALFGFLLSFVILLGMGIEGLIILILFFPVSTHLSLFIRRKREEALTRQGFKQNISAEELMNLPGDRPRLKPDWKQVAANGIVGGIFSLIYFLENSVPLSLDTLATLSFLNPLNLHLSLSEDSALICAYIASIASASADTVSHEIGITTKGKTYLLNPPREVLPGTIGAISLLGSFSALLTIAGFITASLILGMLKSETAIFAVLISAIVGNLTDSLIGSIVEKPNPFWGNNLTNLASTLVAGVLAWVIFSILG